MKLLVDSHVLVWAILNDHRLSRAAKRIFSEGSHEMHFSIASLWELSIKIAKGKLRTISSSIGYLRDEMDEYGIQMVPLRFDHILRAESLEHHHSDPFERILIAQAIEENMAILTDGAYFRCYPVKIIW